MAKILMTPIGIVGGLLAGQVAKKIFDFIWSRVSDEEAPKPDHREIRLAQLVVALLIEGAIFRLAKGLFDRSARKGFERFTGTWPGEERPDAS